MQVLAYGATDVGRVRDHNEDAFYVDSEGGLAVVADGVGGHAAGEVASAMLVEALQESFVNNLAPLAAKLAAGDQRARRKLLRAVPEAIEEASQKIYHHSVTQPGCRGMATTGVVAIVAGDALLAAHVGDSRLYLARDGRFQQLTEDHSYVRKMIKEGYINEDEAFGHPQKNVILRSVGIYPQADAESLYVELQPDDTLLMCSDGLTDMVEDKEIATLVQRYRGETLVDALIQRANIRGGRDNVTVVALDVQASDEERVQRAQQQRLDLFERVELLGQFFLFGELDLQERIKVSRSVHERHFANGEEIVRQGEVGDEVYIVVRGFCEVFKGEDVVGRIPQGGYFGELALLTGDVRQATVRALGDTVCFSIARQDLFAITSEDIALGNKVLWGFLRQMGDKVKGLLGRLTELELSQSRQGP